jgi:hypothetical protein
VKCGKPITLNCDEEKGRLRLSQVGYALEIGKNLSEQFMINANYPCLFLTCISFEFALCKYYFISL